MKLRRNEYRPIHRSVFCGREQARKEPTIQLGVRRIAGAGGKSFGAGIHARLLHPQDDLRNPMTTCQRPQRSAIKLEFPNENDLNVGKYEQCARRVSDRRGPWDDMSTLNPTRHSGRELAPWSLVVFALDGQYALHLGNVERVVRAAEVTPLPRSPNIVLGVINAQGTILPVVNVRRRFRLMEREMEPTDRLIIAKTSLRRVALLVDSVTGVIERTMADVVPAAAIVPQTQYVEGVTKLNENILLVHDLDSFLSLDEERALDDALNSIQ
jgi:purine-binding chemotaxis protein CheW